MAQQLQVQITCPVCELTYKYTACFSLTLGNVDDLPMLNLLRVGKLNHVACLACATPLVLQVPIILDAPQDESLAIYVPHSGEISDQEIETLYLPFYQEFLASLPEDKLQDYLVEPFVVEDFPTFQLIASADYDKPVERPPLTEAEREQQIRDEIAFLSATQGQASGEAMFAALFSDEPAQNDSVPIMSSAPSSVASEFADESVSATEITTDLEGLELEPEEYVLINDRLALLQQIFSLPDPARRQLMAAEQPRIDQIFIELVEVLAEQAAETEPEKRVLLVRIYNEALEIIRANNPSA